jgi:polyisoprenoid-binding protein YceI
MTRFSFLNKPLLATAAVAALSAPAMAAWEVDPTHTHISFQVSHLQLTKTPGIFKRFNATLDFDEKKIEHSSVRFVIDASSIDTAHEGRDKDLQGPDWFDAAANPSITFVSNKVRPAGGNRYFIDGNLSLRGKSVPVTFSARLTNRAENPFLKIPAVGFEATATIKRSAFGMASYLAAISDEVELRVALELLKKP